MVPRESGVEAASELVPGEPERSKEPYRANPLTFEELQLNAWCGDEPVAWEPKLDHDSFKEVWLRFDNDEARLAPYPDQRVGIHHAYTISHDKGGAGSSVRSGCRRAASASGSPSPHPPLNSRYRFEWRLRAPGATG